MADILNPDGSIRPGEAGSFDASGYRLAYGPKNEPLLRPADAGDEHWRDGFTLSGADREVTAIAAAPNGDLYAGGFFQNIGGEPAQGLARWDGQRWLPLPGGAVIGGNVIGMAFLGNDLYVGGAFTAIGNLACNGLARWDGTTWHSVAGLSGRFFAMAASGNLLYVGTRAQNSPYTSSIQRWDGTVWQPLGDFVGAPRTLTAAGNDVYVGGSFTSAGGVPVRNIAHWNGTQWQALGAGVDSTVYALTMRGTDLYVGGQFTQAGNQPAQGLAHWDGTVWSAPGGNHVRVLALTTVGTDLYVSSMLAGAFFSRQTEISRWDGTTWTRLDGPRFRYSQYTRLITVGSNLIAAGRGSWGSSIHRWNGATWNVLGSPGLTDAVRAIARLGSDIYVGGDFVQAGDTPARFLARWDGTRWHALPASPNSSVRALRVRGNDLFVGGNFTRVGSTPANHIARWDGTQWHTLGSGLDGPVNAITTTAAAVFAGGTFTAAGGVPANCVARWDGGSWHALGTGVKSTYSSSDAPGVWALSATDSLLYAGGRFDSAGTVPATCLAVWNGQTWQSVGNLQPSNWVGSLAATDSGVYVGGLSLRMAGRPASLGFWNHHSWQILITAQGQTSAPFAISALDYTAGRLYVGGLFVMPNNSQVGGVAYWQQGQWHALGSGLNGEVGALLVVDSTVYAGGNFLQIGDQSRWSCYFAIYDPSYDNNINGLPGEAADRPRLSLYPNPTSAGRLRLSGTRATTAAFFDAAGREVRRATIGFDGSLEVKDLPPGLYLVRAGSATARLMVE